MSTVFAALAALVLCAGAAAAQELIVTGAETETVLSGPDGSRVELRYDAGIHGSDLDKMAVSYISFTEERDAPCEIRAHARFMNARNNTPAIVAADRCKSQGGNRDTEKDAGFTGTGSSYVSGLRVCLNRDGDRIKGIEVRGRIVNDDGTVVDDPNFKRAERTNCASWKRWVNCPANQIATGVIVTYGPGDRPRSAIGLGLICRRTGVNAAEDDRGAEFYGPTSLTPRAGLSGAHTVDLKATADNNSTVSGLSWAERNDHPCWLRVDGETMTANPNTHQETRNECGGDVGTGSLRRLGEESGYPIFGIRVCLNNERIKGIGVERAHYTVANGHMTAVLQDRQSERQPNCAENDRDWTQYTRCPEGQIAVGVRAFFTGGDKPRDLRGLALICRAIR
jgi:hypothetical protein